MLTSQKKRFLGIAFAAFAFVFSVSGRANHYMAIHSDTHKTHEQHVAMHHDQAALIHEQHTFVTKEHHI